jgi:hypothetical protein
VSWRQDAPCDDFGAGEADNARHLHAVPPSAAPHYVAVEGVEDAFVGELQRIVEHDEVGHPLDLGGIAAGADNLKFFLRLRSGYEIQMCCWTLMLAAYRRKKLQAAFKSHLL